MLSENFDLRCPADISNLSDYFLYRKTGMLRSTFAMRTQMETDVFSYRPVPATAPTASVKPTSSGFSTRPPTNSGGFRFHFDFSGTSSASKPATIPEPSAATSAAASTKNNSPQTPDSTSQIPLPAKEYQKFGPVSSFGDRMIQSISVAKRLKGHNGCINSIEYNDTATLLISGSDDLRVKIYDTSSWKQLASITTEHVANIFSAIMMPDGTNQNLLSCGLDGAICASNLVAGSSSIVHRSRFVMATKLIPLPEWGSGHVAIAGFESGDIAFVDSRTKTIPHKAALFHSKGGATQRIPVNAIASHPHNPNIFAFASDIPYAQLCDIRYLADTSLENCKPRCAFTEVGVTTNRLRNRGIGGIGFSEAGDRLLLNYKDSDLYSVEWLKLANEPSTQFLSTELQAAFSNVQTTTWDEPTDFSNNLNAAYNVASTSVSDKLEHIVCFQERKNRVTMFKEATFLFDDQYVCTGSDDGHVYFWNAANGTLVHKTRGDRNIVNGVLYHPRLPTTVAVCGIDSDVKVLMPSGAYLNGPSFTLATASSTSNFPSDAPLRDLAFEDTNNVHASPTSPNESNDPRRARFAFLTSEAGEQDDDDEWVDPENDEDDDNDDDDSDEEAPQEGREMSASEARGIAQAMAMAFGMEAGDEDSDEEGEDEENQSVEENDNADEEDDDEEWEDIEDEEDDNINDVWGAEEDEELEDYDEDDDDASADEADASRSIQFYPYYYDNFAQIQYACYNAYLMDRYLVNPIVENIQKDVRDAIRRVTVSQGSRDHFEWKPNVAVQRPDSDFAAEYATHMIPYEERLKAEFNNETLRSLIRDAPTNDETPQLQDMNVAKGEVPTTVFPNNFKGDYVSLKKEYDNCYQIMAMTSLMFAAAENGLGSHPTDLESGLRGPDDEYIDALGETRRRANNDQLRRAIRNHEMPSPSVVIQKLLMNYRIIIEEIIRLFAVLKLRDGKNVELAWEKITYGSLSAPPVRRTMASEASFWSNQLYEVEKIQLLLKLLNHYLMPAVRFSCCSSERQTQLILFIAMQCELQIYFGLMTSRSDCVLTGAFFAKRLLSRLDLPSLNRTLSDPREQLFDTATFVVDSLYLWSLLHDSTSPQAAPETIDPASVRRSVRAHIINIQAVSERGSTNPNQSSSRLRAIESMLRPFIDNGTLTNVFEVAFT